MTENLLVTTEQVDDIPVLLAQGEKMGVPELLDRHFLPHGNWQGTSLGWTALVWLGHILSQGDHRLNQVEAWAGKRLHTLEISTGQPVRALEWSDDRLGIVLDELADEKKWQAFEQDLNRCTVRVYALQPQCVRVDSTTIRGYWTVSEDGLFQFGHSKDHRPDLPQLKVMQSALDPLGMPVVTQVVSGESADDPLYIPAIQQVSASLEAHGLLFVGDCKMAALKTRAFIQNSNDFYLCPLSEVQLSTADLELYLQPVWRGQQVTQPVQRENSVGRVENIAEGYEQTVSLRAEIAGQDISWTERRLIVRSLQQARACEEGLRVRLAKAQAELLGLNETRQGKKQFTDRATLQIAADKVLQHYRVEGLLKLKISEQHQEREIRAYGARPARTEIESRVTMQIELDDPAVQAVIDRFGWRVYATNQPQEGLSLDQAVLAYREEFRVEHGFGRLKGQPLSVAPMYLQSDKRATGLIRLLSIGLRILTLIEHGARQQLAQQQEKLSGLYAGNPQRTTDHPTAENLLIAFKGIYLSVVILGDQVLYHVTPLSVVQEKILSLLNFSAGIYTQLISAFPEPAGKMTEP